MTQSRTHSAIETITNTTVGFGLALATQLVVFPAMGLPVTFAGNLKITAIFTAVSIARGYVLRRVFNWVARREPRPDRTGEEIWRDVERFIERKEVR